MFVYLKIELQSCVNTENLDIMNYFFVFQNLKITCFFSNYTQKLSGLLDQILDGIGDNFGEDQRVREYVFYI